MRYVLAIIAISIILLTSCSCNHDSIEVVRKRIIGGFPATVKKHPYQLGIIIKKSVGLKNTDFKGAAIIVSKQWAFTSGNNIAFLDQKLLKAGLVYLRGNVTKWNIKHDFNDHQITETHVHPKYKTYARDYNIALVKVDTPFNGRYEKPINVVGKNYKYRDNQLVTILGWGKIVIGQNGPTESLRSVEIKLINQEQCDKIYSTGYVSPLTPRMICGKSLAKDPCVYDSGGPVVYEKILLALISWGRGCADSHFPEIYTRLTEFHDWIKNYEQQNSVSLNIKFVDK